MDNDNTNAKSFQNLKTCKNHINYYQRVSNPNFEYQRTGILGIMGKLIKVIMSS